MEYQKKIKKFFTDKGLLTQKQICDALGVNKDVLSKWMRADKLTAKFIEKIKEVYPDAPIGYLVSENYIEELSYVEEPREEYKTQTSIIIEEIEEKLKKLKIILAQKSHKN